MKVRDVSGFFSSISLCDMILLFVCLVVVVFCFWKNLQKKCKKKKIQSECMYVYHLFLTIVSVIPRESCSFLTAYSL